jgi:large subunit ribosomal protein L21
MATEYAIVETGGKQYRVEKGDTFVVDRLAEDEGAKISLRAVMFRGASNVVLEPSELEKVKVEAKVAAHERGPKIKVFTYKAKKGYRRHVGHRSELTRLEVTAVKLLSRRPAKAKAATDEEAAVAGTDAASTPKAEPKAPAPKAAAKAAPAKAAAGSTAKPETASGEKAAVKPEQKAARPKAKPPTKGGAKAKAKPGQKRKTSAQKKES